MQTSKPIQFKGLLTTWYLQKYYASVSEHFERVVGILPYLNQFSFCSMKEQECAYRVVLICTSAWLNTNGIFIEWIFSSSKDRGRGFWKVNDNYCSSFIHESAHFIIKGLAVHLVDSVYHLCFSPPLFFLPILVFCETVF